MDIGEFGQIALTTEEPGTAKLLPGSSVVNAIWPNSPLIRRYPRQQHIYPPQGYSVSGDAVA